MTTKKEKKGRKRESSYRISCELYDRLESLMKITNRKKNSLIEEAIQQWVDNKESELKEIEELRGLKQELEEYKSHKISLKQKG